MPNPKKRNLPRWQLQQPTDTSPSLMDSPSYDLGEDVSLCFLQLTAKLAQNAIINLVTSQTRLCDIHPARRAV